MPVALATYVSCLHRGERDSIHVPKKWSLTTAAWESENGQQVIWQCAWMASLHTSLFSCCSSPHHTCTDLQGQGWSGKDSSGPVKPHLSFSLLSCTLMLQYSWAKKRGGRLKGYKGGQLCAIISCPVPFWKQSLAPSPHPHIVDAGKSIQADFPPVTTPQCSVKTKPFFLPGAAMSHTQN